MDQLPRLGKRELVFLLLFTCSFVVSVLGRFLFLLVLGMDCAFLLWHSLGLPLIILKNILTRAKFSRHSKTHFEVTKCNEPRCGLCKYLKEGSTFDFKGQKFSVTSNMDCTVRNVIYVIKCRGCGEYYIGETTNLRNIVTLHNQHIRHKNLRMIPVSGHLASCSNSDPKYFIFRFNKMKANSIIDRKEKEKQFIKKFTPELNS